MCAAGMVLVYRDGTRALETFEGMWISGRVTEKMGYGNIGPGGT